eukprot:TRINITY_DN6363_c1_g1_i3.p1 TRINITY_DN6363_c1_g1~~TRINITY_DN6363_c1_g1_i3.p1  ORF type:complete len:289 (+),score=56.85 TRINITY_DN6363_c1_g1_i3:264-1130(+)
MAKAIYLVLLGIPTVYKQLPASVKQGKLQQSALGWLCYCCLVALSKPQEASEAYELATRSILHPKDRHRIWLHYLRYVVANEPQRAPIVIEQALADAAPFTVPLPTDTPFPTPFDTRLASLVNSPRVKNTLTATAVLLACAGAVRAPQRGRLFLEYVSHYPQNALAMRHAIKFALSRRDYTRARLFCGLALKHHSHMPVFWQDAITVERDDHNEYGARVLLERAVSVHPRCAQLWSLFAEFERNLGMVERHSWVVQNAHEKGVFLPSELQSPPPGSAPAAAAPTAKTR